jgi:hypothetical protein
MNEYVFLVRFGANATLAPEQRQINTEKWGKLIQHWTEQGYFVGSSLITQEGFVLSGSDRKVDQGFIADADFRVVSIIRIAVSSIDEAVELARACPVLDYGGTVEIREVQPRPVLATT